ncbi:MAG: aminotransferase class I/II-fold pyridoxal phosphate-dependent enzyme [Thermomicrobiales bacterium]
MTLRRSSSVRVLHSGPTAECPIRLDLLTNPYGPSMRVHEALASADDLHLPAEERAGELRSRLAGIVGVAPSWLTLGSGADELIRTVVIAAGRNGPVIVFPPTESEGERIARDLGQGLIARSRSHRFGVDLDAADCWSIPTGAVAVVMSPNDPTGTNLSAQDAVRLSRACKVVIVDERHGAYSGRSLVPLVREFDNVIVVQSLETWAGLSGFPVAYAIAPPKMSAIIASATPAHGVAMGSVVAACATLDDLAFMKGTIARVRDEKSRLYRTLRKLNMVRPLPSWANFVLVRVERGERDYFVRELADRKIRVHRPDQVELEDFFRVSATSAEQTHALKQALIEAALPL